MQKTLNYYNLPQLRNTFLIQTAFRCEHTPFGFIGLSYSEAVFGNWNVKTFPIQ